MLEDKPWIRTFDIDGVVGDRTTNRTRMIEYYTPIEGKAFLDLGAADGYESRAVAYRNATKVLAAEGKKRSFKIAQDVQNYLKLPNMEVQQLDVRSIDTYGLPVFDVTLCFGLLYHMQNPFNLLKRARAVTKHLLLLETHVAPSRMKGLLPKHLRSLPFENHRIELDGVQFEGKMVHHEGDPEDSKGTLDASWTFWLTISSLMKAILLAGFEVLDFHYLIDPSTPSAVRDYAQRIGLGHGNTKVFFALAPKQGSAGFSREGTINVIEGHAHSAVGILPQLKKRFFAAIE